MKATSAEEGIIKVHPSDGNSSSPELVVECTPRTRLLEYPLPLHVLIPAEVAGTRGSSSDKSLPKKYFLEQIREFKYCYNINVYNKVPHN